MTGSFNPAPIAEFAQGTNPIPGTAWNAVYGGTFFPPFTKMVPPCKLGGGRRKRRLKTRRGSKYRRQRRVRSRRRTRPTRRSRRGKRRRSRRMRGGNPANTILPQDFVNLGRSVFTNGANLVHNFKGTSITPSPYPTSQHQQQPMQDVFFADLPQVQQISLEAAEAAANPN
jgi:hypothetical protein